MIKFSSDGFPYPEKTKKNVSMDENKYDKIMTEATKKYEFQKKCEDPYAFHKAFEYAKHRVEVNSPSDSIESVVNALEFYAKTIPKGIFQAELFIDGGELAKKALVIIKNRNKV